MDIYCYINLILLLLIIFSVPLLTVRIKRETMGTVKRIKVQVDYIKNRQSKIIHNYFSFIFYQNWFLNERVRKNFS